MASSATNTNWDHEYDTVRREALFRHPPSDHTAYPALYAAVSPHINSFNALFRDDGQPGLLDHGLADIGERIYLDNGDKLPHDRKNCLMIRYKSVSLHTSQLPPSNKVARNRDVYPAECRERHATYRGKLSATFEYRINDGDTHEFTRDLGYMPIMVKVSQNPVFQHREAHPRSVK